MPKATVYKPAPGASMVVKTLLSATKPWPLTLLAALAVRLPMLGAAGFLGVKGRRCVAHESERARA